MRKLQCAQLESAQIRCAQMTNAQITCAQKRIAQLFEGGLNTICENQSYLHLRSISTITYDRVIWNVSKRSR